METSYPTVLSNRTFTRLLGAHGLATLGQLQLTMAAGVDALHRSDSALMVAAAVSLGFAPYVLFSVFAGVIADRFRRSSVLRASIAFRVGLGALVTAGMLMQWPVAMVILLIALTAVVATPSYPAVAAATPQLVSDQRLPTANALVTGVENSAWVAGPGLLGLVLLTNAPVAGGAAAATMCYLLALMCLGRTSTPATGLRQGLSPIQGSAALAGVRAVFTHRRIRATMGVAAADNLLYGYLVVTLVLVADQTYAAWEHGVGLLNTAFAVGAFASLLTTPRLAALGRDPHVMVIGLLLFASCASALALAPEVGIAVTVVFFAGLSTLVVEIVAVTSIQRTAEESLTARVFGVYDTLAVGAVAVGSALAGILSEGLGLGVSLVAVCVVTAAWAAGCAPGVRSLSGDREPRTVA